MDIKNLMERRSNLNETINAIDNAIKANDNKTRGINLEESLKVILLPLALLSFIGSVLTISVTATGDVIANFSGYNPSIFGILLFLLGGIFVFAYLKVRGQK